MYRINPISVLYYCHSTLDAAARSLDGIWYARIHSVSKASPLLVIIHPKNHITKHDGTRRNMDISVQNADKVPGYHRSELYISLGDISLYSCYAALNPPINGGEDSDGYKRKDGSNHKTITDHFNAWAEERKAA